MLRSMSLRRSLQDPATRRLLLAGFSTFMLLGALQAMYGPAFPALRARFGLTPEQVALLVSLHFLGSFVTISLSGVLLAAVGYRRLLLGAVAGFAAGALTLALSPLWAMTLAAALLVGLGYGALVLGVNLLFARTFEARSAPALNLLNAMFGVGAMVGPLLVGAALPNVGLPFLLVGGASLLLALSFRRVADPPPLGSSTDAPRRPLPYAHVAGFVVVFFLYGALEVGTASWETTHLAPYVGAQRADRGAARKRPTVRAAQKSAVSAAARCAPT
jgi:MFS transporter, FHS family, glucose/mannose:H+ symporter